MCYTHAYKHNSSRLSDLDALVDAVVESRRSVVVAVAGIGLQGQLVGDKRGGQVVTLVVMELLGVALVGPADGRAVELVGGDVAGPEGRRGRQPQEGQLVDGAALVDLLDEAGLQVVPGLPDRAHAYDLEAAVLQFQILES